MPSFDSGNSDYHIFELLVFVFGILAGINVLLARKKLFYLIGVLGVLIVSVRLVNDNALHIWI